MWSNPLVPSSSLGTRWFILAICWHLIKVAQNNFQHLDFENDTNTNGWRIMGEAVDLCHVCWHRMFTISSNLQTTEDSQENWVHFRVTRADKSYACNTVPNRLSWDLLQDEKCLAPSKRSVSCGAARKTAREKIKKSATCFALKKLTERLEEATQTPRFLKPWF